MDFTLVTPAILVVVFILAEVLKKVFLKNNDKLRTLIPIFCAATGIAIALAIYFLYPRGANYSNAVEAIASGGLSGLAATGSNQLYKQFTKFMSSDDDAK